MYIYIIINIINSKFYIGKTQYTIKGRWLQHISDAFDKNCDYHLHNAIRKHGVENFKIKKLCKCNNLNVLNKMEKYLISKRNPNLDNKVGYNMMEGGSGGRQGEEGRRKISEANVRRFKDINERIKVGLGNKDRKRTPEQNERNRQAQLNRRPISVESRVKMSNSQKKRFESQEERRKCSHAVNWSEESKIKLSDSKKQQWKEGVYANVNFKP